MKAPTVETIVAIFTVCVIGLLTTLLRRGYRTNALALVLALSLAGGMGGPLALGGGLTLSALLIRKGRGASVP